MELNKGIRINKYLSSAGYCSRREADRLVEAGRVSIDGVQAQMGSQVIAGQEVCVDNTVITQQEERVLLAFNKPVGVVCTTADPHAETTIVDYIGYPTRIYPVGRLDKDSQGLILMTNDGNIMNEILRAANGHEKEYIVEVDRDIDDEFIENMSNGVYLEELERTTNPCKVIMETKRRFRITLTQGLNRQIRRMCDNQGRIVTSLTRVRIMNILLGDLPVGTYREITGSEYEMLTQMLQTKNGEQNE